MHVQRPISNAKTMAYFLSGLFVMVFGYAYPAYKCYKTVERNEPQSDRDHLLFWCKYWILVAVITTSDPFISWLPMHSEAKIALFIYLWHPKTKGATNVYNSLLKPYMEKHEKEIDTKLAELTNRTCKIVLLVWAKAVSYGQLWLLEIFHYIASQSMSLPPPTQPRSTHHRSEIRLGGTG